MASTESFPAGKVDQSAVVVRPPFAKTSVGVEGEAPAPPRTNDTATAGIDQQFVVVQPESGLVESETAPVNGGAEQADVSVDLAVVAEQQGIDQTVVVVPSAAVVPEEPSPLRAVVTAALTVRSPEPTESSGMDVQQAKQQPNINPIVPAIVAVDEAIEVGERRVVAANDNIAVVVPEPLCLATTAEPPPTWGDFERIDPKTLLDHPLWHKLLGPESPEKEEELIEFLRRFGARTWIEVTGEGCASPPGTILDGHRMWNAVRVIARSGPVLVRRRTDLTADAEETIIVQSALAGQHVRRLKESQKATLEARLIRLYAARGQGYRSDLTSAGTSGSKILGDTRDLVAADSGSTRNAVEDRRTIFCSPVAPLVLREAVDAGTLSRTAAAELTREIERDPNIEAALKDVGSKSLDAAEQHPVLVAARERLEAAVREQLGKPKKKPRTARSPSGEPTRLEGIWHGQVLVAMGNYRGRRIRIRVEGVGISLTDLGAAPPPREGKQSEGAASMDDSTTLMSGADVVAATKTTPIEARVVDGAQKRRLPVVDQYGRSADDSFVEGEVARGAWRPFVVPPEVSGLTRPMTIFLAERKAGIIKAAWHGDAKTFCPPTWADIAIGSGACGFGCRSCFLMLTFRLFRDPLRPVVYDNGDRFDRQVRGWLTATRWKVEGKGMRSRTAKDAIGLGIDCSDSLLWEGVTGHARRLIPLFTSAETNPLGNPLVLLTKSSNTRYLTEMSDAVLRRVGGQVPNVAVTMSLNPEPIADLWEGKFPDTMERITPPIDRRLEALRQAQDAGFEVRARIDPILTPEGWEDMYAKFFHDMAQRDGLRPTMLTLGSHREKFAVLDTFREMWGLPALEWEAEKTAGREGTHVHMAGRETVYIKIREIICDAFRGTGHMPHVSLCKETHDVRRETDMCNANCNCLPISDVPRHRLPVLGSAG